MKYSGGMECKQRLLANQCEVCGITEGQMEVHPVCKLTDLKTKKHFMYLDRKRLERNKKRLSVVISAIMTTMSSKFRLVNWRAVYAERCTYGSEGETVKPAFGDEARRMVSTLRPEAKQGGY